MKNLFLICFLFYLSLTIEAQFFALSYDSVNPYVTALPYPKDGNYRVLLYDQRFPTLALHKPQIKVYDSLQHYVKTIHLLNGITLVNDYPPLLHNKHLLWPANYNDTIEHLQNTLVILDLDTNYNFIALHKISSHTNIAAPSGLVAYSNGFVVGEYFNSPTVSVSGYSTKVYKLNLNFQKKDSVLLLDELRLKTHLSKNNKIVGASDNISPTCASTMQVTQKIVLDTNLTIFDCLNIHYNTTYFCYDGSGNVILIYHVNFKPKGIIFPLSNNKNYIQGENDNYYCPQGTLSKEILSAVIQGTTMSNQILNSSSPLNTEFPLYNASNCDYNGLHTIYVGTIGLKNNYLVDKQFYRPYFAKSKTKISVTKLDTSGNLVWKKQFGGEMNYFARSVAFTSDGGCIIAGSRYDSASHYNIGVFQNFLLRLDASGEMLTLGIKKSDELFSGKISCFPNPANKSIYFDLPQQENANIQIFNSTGQLILQKNNYSNHTLINIAELDAGIYIYQVRTSKNIFNGKLLKE